MSVTAETVVLTAEDRCDRCGAAAKALVLLPSGGELMFCGHHWRRHEDRLRDVGAEIRQCDPLFDMTPRRQP